MKSLVNTVQLAWSAAIASLWLVASPMAFAQDPFSLRDADRVVFYGDSITDQRRYTSFVETYVVTRFPNLNVVFTHSGWGGDRVTGGGGGPIDVRLWRDVLPYKPTVVTIMLGMNDGGYRAFDSELFNTYSKGFQHIVDTLRQQLPGVRITAILPSPYDDVTHPPTFEGGYNKVLLRYSDFLRQYAATKGLTVSDFNEPVVSVLAKANATDPTTAAKLIPDRVHPTEQFTLVMAEELLKTWHAPSLVSEVEIDAAHHTAASQTHAKVTGLSADHGLAWTELDESLPMPVSAHDPLMALVLKSSDFMTALNREVLRVKGLAAGQYQLRIDGESVESFSAAQLASGINLAEYATPMFRQAAAVHALTLQHNNIHFSRWRQLQVPLQTDESAELLDGLKALDQLEARLVTEQHEAAKPVSHHYQLTLAPAAK